MPPQTPTRASFKHWRGEPLIALALLIFLGYCGVSVIDHLQAWKVKRARADLSRLSQLLRSYVAAHGHAPPAESWQRALIDDGRTKTVPNDPWGHPYRYEIAPGRVDVGTLGRDAAPGGEGPDADLSESIPVPQARLTPPAVAN